MDMGQRRRQRGSQYNGIRRGYTGVGPKIDTNLDEARRLAAIDSQLRKQREFIEMVNSQFDKSSKQSKQKGKESATKAMQQKLQLNINNSNFNMKNKLENNGNQDQQSVIIDKSGANSARNGNLTPRMNTFDMSVNYRSETTGFQTPLTCKQVGNKRNKLGQSYDFQNFNAKLSEFNTQSSQQIVSFQ